MDLWALRCSSNKNFRQILGYIAKECYPQKADPDPNFHASIQIYHSLLGIFNLMLFFWARSNNSLMRPRILISVSLDMALILNLVETIGLFIKKYENIPFVKVFLFLQKNSFAFHSEETGLGSGSARSRPPQNWCVS
jgi:hypothetical protein